MVLSDNMIYTKTFVIPKNRNIENFILNTINEDGDEPNHTVLRYYISKVNDYTVEVTASILEDGYRMGRDYKIPFVPNNKFDVVMIIPTGVRAEIGGFIADATPTVNVLAEVCDKVIVHPNVVNGSFLNYARENVLYVEGSILDNFLQNKIALSEVLQNKIGVIIDRGALESEKTLNTVINVIESLRVITGINCIGYKITNAAIGGHAIQMESGAFCGEVSNPNTLIEAGEELIKAGATALAVATRISIDNLERDLDKYFRGELANPFGGTEALISHTLCEILHVPAAHAPILSQSEINYYNECGIVDPRAAPEIASPNYLGCILKGLNKSPQLSKNGITLSDVKAIVIPYGCCGGIPALAAQKFNIPLIAVKENETCLNVTPELMGFKNYIIAENYWEVVGIISALKAGISPDMLRRPIKPIQELRS